MYNEKQTKNIITKEIIANELHAKNKKSIVLFAGLAFIYIIVLGTVFSIIYFIGLKGLDIGTIGHIIFFICLFICSLPVFVIIFPKRGSITGSKGQNDKSFCVITDEVVYKEEMTYRRRGVTLIKKIVHFSRFGDVEVNATWYQLASKNDIYYMVVHDKNSKTVIKCYPAKLYEYKE